GVTPDPVTAELRAMAHPLRLRMLSLLTGAPLTAAEIARDLGITHANASYHLRQLADTGHIEVVGEERIRGGVAKRYRYIVDRPAEGQPDPTHLPVRRALYAALASELLRRSAFLADSPDRSHLTDADLWVTPDAWTDFRDHVQAASVALH